MYGVLLGPSLLSKLCSKLFFFPKKILEDTSPF